MEQRNVIAALSALAQPSRLDIYRLLVQAGPAGLAAGAIGETLDIPAATLSFHLAQLRHAALITNRRESRSLIYAAQYDVMNGLMAYLSENCCQGAEPTACTPAECSPYRDITYARSASNARHERV